MALDAPPLLVFTAMLLSMDPILLLANRIRSKNKVGKGHSESLTARSARLQGYLPAQARPQMTAAVAFL